MKILTKKGQEVCVFKQTCNLNKIKLKNLTKNLMLKYFTQKLEEEKRFQQNKKSENFKKKFKK